jgi:hypothetical protein
VATITTSPCIAVPFEPTPVEKLALIVNKCCEHRAWFSDYDWEKGEAHRRTMVIARLSNASSKSWEVYRDGVIVGLLHADEITPRVDCRCHFIFFDHELRDKRQLCRATMRWLFEHYDLHTLRVQIPTYAAKLAGFARKALSFKYEAENRPFSWPSSSAPLDADAAKLGSRLHHAIFHDGKWHDLLLLSLTRDEFEQGEDASADRPIANPAEAH